MAGRNKHRERSHRSYTTRHYRVFEPFNRTAYNVAFIKESKKSVGQRFASLLRKIVPSAN